MQGIQPTQQCPCWYGPSATRMPYRFLQVWIVKFNAIGGGSVAGRHCRYPGARRCRSRSLARANFRILSYPRWTRRLLLHTRWARLRRSGAWRCPSGSGGTRNKSGQLRGYLRGAVRRLLAIYAVCFFYFLAIFFKGNFTLSKQSSYPIKS